jgi:hypothetical protein
VWCILPWEDRCRHGGGERSSPLTDQGLAGSCLGRRRNRAREEGRSDTRSGRRKDGNREKGTRERGLWFCLGGTREAGAWDVGDRSRVAVSLRGGHAGTTQVAAQGRQKRRCLGCSEICRGFGLGCLRLCLWSSKSFPRFSNKVGGHLDD